MWNFAGWMCTGTIVNSGLRYVESLLAIEMRQALTKAAHTRYLEGHAFYKAAVLREGNLDNVDHRIVGDIEAFSREAAQLYGHSFKPILEFVLSLSEAAKELGLPRPLTLFASQARLLLRSCSRASHCSDEAHSPIIVAASCTGSGTQRRRSLRRSRRAPLACGSVPSETP